MLIKWRQSRWASERASEQRAVGQASAMNQSITLVLFLLSALVYAPIRARAAALQAERQTGGGSGGDNFAGRGAEMASAAGNEFKRDESEPDESLVGLLAGAMRDSSSISERTPRGGGGGGGGEEAGGTSGGRAEGASGPAQQQAHEQSADEQWQQSRPGGLLAQALKWSSELELSLGRRMRETWQQIRKLLPGL